MEKDKTDRGYLDPTSLPPSNSTGPLNDQTHENYDESELKDIVAQLMPDGLSEDALDKLLAEMGNDEVGGAVGGGPAGVGAAGVSKNTLVRNKSINRGLAYEDDSDDEDMERELMILAAAESELREELEMAGGFGDRMLMMAFEGGDGLGKGSGEEEREVPDWRFNFAAPRWHYETNLSAALKPMGENSRSISGEESLKKEAREGTKVQVRSSDPPSSVDTIKMQRSLVDVVEDGDDDCDDDEGTVEREDVWGMIAKTANGMAATQSSERQGKPLPVVATRRNTLQRPRPYTLFDHAKVLRVEALPADCGLFTAPLLSQSDIEGLFAVPSMPSFDASMFTPEKYQQPEGVDLGEVWSSPHSNPLGEETKTLNSEKNQLNDKVKDEYLQLMSDCAREYIASVSSTELRKIFGGLVLPIDGREEQNKQQRGDNFKGGDGTDDERNDEGNVAAEPLPVRTVAIKIRPDVLCGAVMDALSHAVENVGGEMTKRQGGHLRAVLPGFWMKPAETFHEADASVISGLSSLHPFDDGHSSIASAGRENSSDTVDQSRMTMLPPILVDAQLVARRRARFFDRTLLIRTFRVGGCGIEGVSGWEGRSAGPVTSNTYADCDSVVDEDEDGLGGTMIRETASLVQKMTAEGGDFSGFSPISRSPTSGTSTATEATSYVGHIGNILTSPLRLFTGSHGGSDYQERVAQKDTSTSTIFPDPYSVTEAVSLRLRRQYKPTSSVQRVDEYSQWTTYPALSDEDWPFVRSSWRFLKECLNELDNRDLAYSTLSTCPFGAFPALPTLDAHYCSHIHMLCREAMIASLLRSAAELEQFARESELSCANLILLLRPTFELYDLLPPALPAPIPLTAYPLDFRAPELVCPPWGQRVMEAMNRVAAMSSTDNVPAASVTDRDQDFGTGAEGTKQPPRSKVSVFQRRMEKFQFAEGAIMQVIHSFQRQADDEQSARMGRKNVQVMDRLAKMQAHKRVSIITIRDSYGLNAMVSQGADEFHSKAFTVTKLDENTNTAFFTESDQVPLLKCSILVGGLTGSFFVTSHQLLFVTHLIPLVGSGRSHIFPIIDVELKVQESSSSILPARIVICRIHRGEESEQEEVFSFIPSIAAHRLKAFVEVVQSVATEDPETLKFSNQGGMLYLLEEKRSIANAAIGSLAVKKEVNKSGTAGKSETEPKQEKYNT